jgi:hypothetical protein
MKRGGFVQTRCPKCGGGNVYLENDSEGWYEECLQCGCTTDLTEMKAKEILGKVPVKV